MIDDLINSANGILGMPDISHTSVILDVNDVTGLVKDDVGFKLMCPADAGVIFLEISNIQKNIGDNVHTWISPSQPNKIYNTFVCKFITDPNLINTIDTDTNNTNRYGVPENDSTIPIEVIRRAYRLPIQSGITDPVDNMFISDSIAQFKQSLNNRTTDSFREICTQINGRSMRVIHQADEVGIYTGGLTYFNQSEDSNGTTIETLVEEDYNDMSVILMAELLKIGLIGNPLNHINTQSDININNLFGLSSILRCTPLTYIFNRPTLSHIIRILPTTSTTITCLPEVTGSPYNEPNDKYDYGINVSWSKFGDIVYPIDTPVEPFIECGVPDLDPIIGYFLRMYDVILDVSEYNRCKEILINAIIGSSYNNSGEYDVIVNNKLIELLSINFPLDNDLFDIAINDNSSFNNVVSELLINWTSATDQPGDESALKVHSDILLEIRKIYHMEIGKIFSKLVDPTILDGPDGTIYDINTVDERISDSIRQKKYDVLVLWSNNPGLKPISDVISQLDSWAF